MSAYGHEPGKPLECLSIAVELHKEPFVDENGQPAFKVGFKIGGGIDQDPTRAPFRYPDTVRGHTMFSAFIWLQGIYITHIEADSPAEGAGLRQHDKILEVGQGAQTHVRIAHRHRCLNISSSVDLV